jgi:hypothetical protein
VSVTARMPLSHHMTYATTLSLRPGSLSVYISPWGPCDSDPSLFSFRFYFYLYTTTRSGYSLWFICDTLQRPSPLPLASSLQPSQCLGFLCSMIKVFVEVILQQTVSLERRIKVLWKWFPQINPVNFVLDQEL